MSSARALCGILPAMVVCAFVSHLAAEEPDSGYRLPRGTKAIAFKLHKDQQVPDGVVPGTAVDVVGEISEPIKTGIAILNVRLLAMDPKYEGKEQTVTVQLTLAQEEVLTLMKKHGTKLGIKEKPKS